MLFRAHVGVSPLLSMELMPLTLPLASTHTGSLMPLRVHVPVLRPAFPLLTVDLVPLIPPLGIPHLPWRMPPQVHVGASPLLYVELMPLTLPPASTHSVS